MIKNIFAVFSWFFKFLLKKNCMQSIMLQYSYFGSHEHYLVCRRL